MIRARIIAACLFFAIAPLSARADQRAEDFSAGLSAFTTGDYARAWDLWRPLAESRDPRSEAGVGYMYHRGLGVPVDDLAAAYWLRRAADQGQAEAQLMLGLMYHYGRGVGRSLPDAFAWCEVAGENGNADAVLCRDAALESMSAAERETAFRLVVEIRERRRLR